MARAAWLNRFAMEAARSGPGGGAAKPGADRRLRRGRPVTEGAVCAPHETPRALRAQLVTHTAWGWLKRAADVSTSTVTGSVVAAALGLPKGKMVSRNCTCT